MFYYIETYGCQMNKAESSAIELQCEEHGWTKTDSSDNADIVFINTCSVRITAETRAWGRIAHHAAVKKKQHFTLVVIGCMAERLKDDIKERIPDVDYVIGTFQKQTIGLLLDAVKNKHKLSVLEETPVFSFAPSHYEKGAFSAFVPIMHGCNNFCTYCIVPYLRGQEISRTPTDILSELKNMADNGIVEATLLGQNVNSYNWKDEATGQSVNFADLLKLIVNYEPAKNIQRLRFLSSHPKDLSDDIIQVLANNDRFAKHIHLCVQHGSDAVLKRMNRHYTSADYMNLVKKLRDSIPNITISTDILIGFPGETDDDIDATLKLMTEARFIYAFMYHYNPREGTKAASMDMQIPDKVKKARLASIIALQKAISTDLMSKMIGTEVNVLVEGLSKHRKDEVLGKSDQDLMVVFKADESSIGRFSRVRLESLKGNTFRAVEV